MKLIHKLTLILAVLLVSTAFVGAGAAFTYSSSDAVLTPATALTAGQTVTATMKITITAGSLGMSDRISLATPLTGAKWSTDIYRGGVAIVNDYESASISGFMLDSDSDLVLHITLSGKVSYASEGKEISVMTITATSKETNGYSSYATKKQKVYDVDNFEGDLAALEKSVSSMKTRVATYTGYGINTAAVNETIKQAESKYSAAKTAGINNVITAYANIEAADTYLDKGERELALAGLKVVEPIMGNISTVVTTLYNRGLDNEALYLETKSLSLTLTYDTLCSTYNEGNTPDASKMDAFMTDLQKTKERANQYLPIYEDPSEEVILPNVLTLKNGWNFISVPKALATGTASSLFAGVDTKDSGILSYDASDQSWKQVTADTLIKPLNGYWIYSNGTSNVSLSYVTEPTVPAVKQLYTGWNAVGVSAENAVPASSLFAGIDWRVALPWNAADMNWDVAVVNGGSSANSAEQYLNIGNGIWLYVDTNGTMIGLTA